MRMFYRVLVRRSLPLLSAGILLQAGGCDPGALVAQTAQAILTQLIGGIVFGAFNLV